MIKRLLVFAMLLAATAPALAENRSCEKSLVHVVKTVNPISGRVSYQAFPAETQKWPAAPQPGSGLKHQYMKLARWGALISQTDPRLAHRQLLIPDGGLCATTCAVNVLHAVTRFAAGHGQPFENASDEQIHKMVRLAAEKYSRDARAGLDFWTLAELIRILGYDLGLNLEVYHQWPGAAYLQTLKDISPRSNELILVALESGLRQGRELYHALVLVSGDPETGVVVYSDPNQPNDLMQTNAYVIEPFRAGRTVKIGYDSPEPTVKTGIVQSWIRVIAR